MTRRVQTHGDAILAEIADLLIDIRDRLPGPTELRLVRGRPEPEAAVEPVQVREPAPVEPPSGEGAAGDRDGGEVEPVLVTEPAPPPPPRTPARKTAAKKAARPAKKTTAKKET